MRVRLLFRIVSSLTWSWGIVKLGVGKLVICSLGYSSGFGEALRAKSLKK